jgi:hypothetical protein
MIRDDNSAQKLALLQYNVNKSRSKVQIGLFQDPRILRFDIIALQEPWRNRHNQKGYNSQNAFTLIEVESLETRVATYISKDIPIEQWNEIYKEKDLISISIQKGPKKVYIHNIYLAPSPHRNRETPEALQKVLELIQLEGEHILLGDFNLHHPLWNPENNGHHRIANSLLESLTNRGLELILPPKTVTRDCQRGPHHEQSTLDLIFTTVRLVEECRIATELEQSSDHLPIMTTLQFPHNTETRTTGPQKRNWKALDQESFIEAIDKETTSLTAISLATEQDIDLYTSILVKAIQKAIEKAVPERRKSPFSKPFWTLDCKIAVLETRYLRRQYTHNPTEDNWSSFVSQRNLKGKIISKAKQAFYREYLNKTHKDGLWRPYKQAKRANIASSSTLPTLIDREVIATTIEEKANLLRNTAFAQPKEAILENLEGYSYPEPLQTLEELTEDEISKAGLRALPDNAPGPDGIPNRVIHLLIRQRIALLSPLFQACWKQGYHPKAFHIAQTVFLQKPGKADYTTPKAYRPIALLNTLGKVLEAIVATRLKQVSEENNLLPNTQFGARPQRSTSSALFSLLERIKLAKAYKLIPSLLALDVQKAFDNVSHKRLLHNLEEKRVPKAILRWISSFLEGRSTSIQLGEYISAIKAIDNTGIPQGSPISPILYLFYNAPLLKDLEEVAISIDPIGFVDDITLLTYSPSVKQNCRRLKEAYQHCLSWAKAHGAIFNPEKSELIHFTKRKGAKESITLENQEITPKKTIRILGVYLNRDLSPSAHLEALKARLPQLQSLLGRLVNSTWGIGAEIGRAIYLQAIRPVLSYGAIAWYPLNQEKGAHIDTLEKWQGKFLRRILGAYKATSNQALEIESYTEPLDLYIERQATITLEKQAIAQKRSLEGLKDQIERKVRNPRRRTTGRIQIEPNYAQLVRELKHQREEYNPVQRGSTSRGESQEGSTSRNESPNRLKRALEKHSLRKWTQRWINSTKGRAIYALNPLPSQNTLKLYRERARPISSITIQLRSQKIGLQAFLYSRKVSGIESANCPYCEENEETTQHFLLECRQWERERGLFLALYRERSLNSTLETREGCLAAARFVIATRRLEQYKAIALEQTV